MTSGMTDAPPGPDRLGRDFGGLWLAQGVPNLGDGVYVAGALLDRWELRRVMWTVDAARLVVVGGFAAAVLLGWASIPLLMATGFLLGTGQTRVDTGSQALIPALVSRNPGRLES
jgi:hypothetical protein